MNRFFEKTAVGYAVFHENHIHKPGKTVFAENAM